ncbi:tex36 [Pungitius sinensis]
MVKGGKRYSSMSNDGKWFAHPVSPENETWSREISTSTGFMLTQVQSSLPQALDTVRFPKWNTQQIPREHPFSHHDNKQALRDHISVFAQGVGRRKFLHHRSDPHLLCHDGADGGPDATGRSATVHRADFTAKQAVGVPTGNRRFPRDHKQRSAEAAPSHGGGTFLWFGRLDSKRSETLQVQAAAAAAAAAADCSAPPEPLNSDIFRHLLSGCSVEGVHM